MSDELKPSADQGVGGPGTTSGIVASAVGPVGLSGTVVSTVNLFEQHVKDLLLEARRRGCDLHAWSVEKLSRQGSAARAGGNPPASPDASKR